MSKTITLVVKKWGNDLALRIPAKLAKEQRLSAGQLVEVLLQVSSKPQESHSTLELEQLLSQFDPKKHGGEVMTTTAIGIEAM